MQGAKHLINARIVREATKKILAESRGASAAVTSQSAADASDPYQSVKPPIRVYGLAGQYVTALYSAGSKAKELDRISEDLSQIAQVAEKNKMFKAYLKDPTVPRHVKKESLGKVLDQLDACKLAKNFVGLLAEKNRLDHFLEINSTFDEVMRAHRGEVKATITTCRGVEQESRDEIIQILSERFLQPGQTLTLEDKIDPKLVAGFTVRVGQQFFDNCLATRIKKVEQLILDAPLE